MFNNAILKNFVSRQLEKKALEQAKEQAMQQQGMPPQQGIAPPQFQTGGPNPGNEDDVIPVPSPSSVTWNVSPDAIAGVVDGQSYVTPGNVHVQYDDDEIFESIFDERVAQRNAENASVTAANKKARAEWQQAIADINEGARLHQEFWNVDFPRTNFTTGNQVQDWMKTQKKWLDSTALLARAGAIFDGVGPNTPRNMAGISIPLHFDSGADLSSIYPAAPSYEVLPHDIEYNLPILPEDVDEGMFRKWIHNYYPEYAAKNEIDISVPGKGGSDRIRSAWYELGPQYKKADQTLDMPFRPIPDMLERKLAPHVPIDTQKQSRGRLVLRQSDDGRIVVDNISTGGSYGTYDTPEQARVAMIEAYTDGYDLLNSKAFWDPDGSISSEKLGRLYDIIEDQPEFVPNQRQQANWQAIRGMKEDGGPVRKLKLPKAQTGEWVQNEDGSWTQMADDASSSDHQEFHPFQGYKHGKPPKSIPKVEENSSSNSTFPAPPVMRAHPDSNPSLYSPSPSSESAPPSAVRTDGIAAYEAILAEEARLKAQEEYDKWMQFRMQRNTPTSQMHSGRMASADWFWTLPIGMTRAPWIAAKEVYKHGARALYDNLFRSPKLANEVVKRVVKNPNAREKVLKATNKYATIDKIAAASAPFRSIDAGRRVYNDPTDWKKQAYLLHSLSATAWPWLNNKYIMGPPR